MLKSSDMYHYALSSVSFYILKTLAALITTEKSLYQSLTCVYILFNQSVFSLTSLCCYSAVVASPSVYSASVDHHPCIQCTAPKKKYRNSVPRQKSATKSLPPKGRNSDLYSTLFFLVRVSDYTGELSGKNFLPIFGHSFTSKPLFVLLPITP